MHTRRALVAVCPLALTLACGGPPQEATAPSEPAPAAEPIQAEPADALEPEEEDAMDAEADDDTEPKEAPPPEPDFPENASVAEAIAAVPQGSQRLNLDHETLAKPLQDPALYEPCDAGTKHFTMKIAIWNGRAVGVDVKTKDEQLKTCLTEQIKQIEWDDKVPSLNTIEYGF